MCVNEFTFCFVHCANRITDNTHPFFKHFLDCRIVRTGSRVGVVPAWFAVPLMVISCQEIPEDFRQHRSGSLRLQEQVPVRCAVQCIHEGRSSRAPGLPHSQYAAAHHPDVCHQCRQCPGFSSARSPCIDERSHHIGLITDTLFVCECADSNRAGRFDPGFSESPDDSQAGQDTVTTIESAGVYNGVNMGANHQWLLFVSTIYRRQCAII